MDEIPPETDEETRIHRADSDDGTEIAGRVHGEGPPLVLVPGAMGDGEFVWDPLLPSLTERFTCYTMSVRSRGLSGHSTDLSTDRRIQDVVAFVDSVGEPVGLLGWSQGGQLVLGAAEHTDAVTRLGELAAEGRPVDGARSFFEWVSTEEEMDEMDEAMMADFIEGCAVNVQLLLHGDRSDPWFINGVHHVAEHATDSQVREIESP